MSLPVTAGSVMWEAHCNIRCVIQINVQNWMPCLVGHSTNSACVAKKKFYGVTLVLPLDDKMVITRRQRGSTLSIQLLIMYIDITNLTHLHSCNHFTFFANTETELRSSLLVWAEWQVCRYPADVGIEKGWSCCQPHFTELSRLMHWRAVCKPRIYGGGGGGL